MNASENDKETGILEMKGKKNVTVNKLWWRVNISTSKKEVTEDKFLVQWFQWAYRDRNETGSVNCSQHWVVYNSRMVLYCYKKCVMVPGYVTQVMRWINWDIYVITVVIGLLCPERETSEQTSTNTTHHKSTSI